MPCPRSNSTNYKWCGIRLPFLLLLGIAAHAATGAIVSSLIPFYSSEVFASSFLLLSRLLVGVPFFVFFRVAVLTYPVAA